MAKRWADILGAQRRKAVISRLNSCIFSLIAQEWIHVYSHFVPLSTLFCSILTRFNCVLLGVDQRGESEGRGEGGLYSNFEFCVYIDEFCIKNGDFALQLMSRLEQAAQIGEKWAM